MDLITVVGIAAPIVSVVSFLPQVLKCWTTKRTKDISYPSYIIFFAGSISWLTYGILKNDLSIIITNSFLAFFVFLILLMKFKFG